MSSVSGLDQLCAAACERGTQPAGGQPPPEIKVIELDAYATVADLIHAAVSANDGAAALKEIYDVCEKHGRIAYRRADGSRLITTNDHWKSQVRHALYTGGRFERLPSNGELWQLGPAHRGTDAELIKVLVRADDPTAHIRASNSLPPSTERGTVGRGTTPSRAPSTTARQRRKRAMTNGGGAGSAAAAEAVPSTAEAFCDSVDHGGTTSGPLPQRFSTRKGKQRSSLFEGGPLDNHSTQDDVEDGDEVHELPRERRGNRRAAAAPWRSSNLGAMPEGVYGAPSHDEQLSGLRHGNNLSRSSNDPSSLRWGSTALRSTIIIAADSTLSAGRTPILRQTAALAKARAGSAEADSAPFHNWLARGHPQDVGEPVLGPPQKRQARHTPNEAALPTPNPWADMAARSTPPEFMAHWAEAIHQRMHQANMARHQASVIGAQQQTESSLPPNSSPFGMLPSYLPGMLASATAPFMGGQQQVPFDLQKQLEAFILSSQQGHQAMQQQQQQMQQQSNGYNGSNVGQWGGEAPQPK